MPGIGFFIIGQSAIGVGGLDDYLGLVTSEHRDRPKFIAMLTAYLQPFIDGMDQTAAINDLFDLDVAGGVQLDIDGLWIGRSRNLSVPITGVYFTFDIGPGFDLGIFKGPFDPASGLVSLPDAQYRLLLKAVAAANSWNGSIPGAYEAYAILFQGTPFQVLIFDWQDMSMSLALIGGVPDAVTTALFTGGYLSLRPDGVRVREYIVPGVTGPVFGFDTTDNPNIAGFDQGAFATYYTGGP